MAVFRGVHFNAMGFLDRLMDMLTRRGTKLVASGHAPADTAPQTGSNKLSTELQADYGADTPAAEPPAAPPPSTSEPPTDD